MIGKLLLVNFGPSLHNALKVMPNTHKLILPDKIFKSLSYNKVIIKPFSYQTNKYATPIFEILQPSFCNTQQ